MTHSRIVYPSIHKEKKIYKKDKKITFVGKLNESKGYDIYKDSVTRILNEFNNWKAYSIGDESRERPKINHKNQRYYGKVYGNNGNLTIFNRGVY